MDLHLLVSSLIILLISFAIRKQVVTHDKLLGEIFFFAFFIRFIFALFQDIYQIIPYVWDERAFLLAGESFSDYLNLGVFSFPFKEINSITSYGTFLGFISEIFGNYSFIYRIINGLIGSILILLVFKISRMILDNKQSSYFIAILVALTPSYIIFTSLIMRDSIVWILTLLVYYFFLKAISNLKVYNIYIGILLSTILVLFRKLNAPILVFLAFLALILIIVQRKYYIGRIELKFFKILFISALGIVGLILSILTLFFILSSYGRGDFIDYASSELIWRNQGGGAYLEYVSYKSFYDIVYYFPIKFFHFFFGPFIWNANSSFTLLASLESVINTIFILLIGFKMKDFFIMEYKRKIIFIYTFIFTFGFIAANSIIDANYGTAIRHKMIFMPTFYILSFILIENSKMIANQFKIKL